MKLSTEELVPIDQIESKIFVIRGKKVMMDRDIAELYEVETRLLNQAVKRNMRRFPADFMFQLTPDELEKWKSQIVISNKEKIGIRKPPYAFTEHGIAMLSGVLQSQRAIEVNIQIIRTFAKLRQMVSENRHLQLRLDALEAHYDKQFKTVFEAIRRLLPQRRID